MSRDEEFEKFWVNQFENCPLDEVEAITKEEMEYIRGYFNAVKDLRAVIINARQMTHDIDYPMLNEFIDGITKIMCDETIQGMEDNLDVQTTIILNSHEEGGEEE